MSSNAEKNIYHAIVKLTIANSLEPLTLLRDKHNHPSKSTMNELSIQIMLIIFTCNFIILAQN
ncbi:MAG: hypothetical protein BWX81_01447 [Spirochaetes bacterium ADurb.Bin110]|nr:MAG: hypothetical protein BWX81_01447 [Spirochaetes bacterium ADurb.Bin110]